jgi:hypothetical protein
MSIGMVGYLPSIYRKYFINRLIWFSEFGGYFQLGDALRAGNLESTGGAFGILASSVMATASELPPILNEA